jgi:hypothetical protein
VRHSRLTAFDSILLIVRASFIYFSDGLSELVIVREHTGFNHHFADHHGGRGIIVGERDFVEDALSSLRQEQRYGK